MTPRLPEGSAIQVENQGGGYRITLPLPSGAGPGRFLAAGFLGLWLLGWAAGEAFALWAVLSRGVPGVAKIFLLFWLIIWTLGGLFALRQVRMLIAKPQPERVELDRYQLTWTPGTGLASSRVRGRPGSLAKGRRPVRLTRAEITAIQLAETGGEQRLLIACHPEPFEMGSHLSREDRAWLEGLLQSWKASSG